jgi:hypothetical protein
VTMMNPLKYRCLIGLALALYHSAESFGLQTRRTCRPSTALFENVLPVATSVDSFSSYSQGNPTLELAYKDVVIGSGEVASMGKVLTVAYKGRLLSNGKQFDEGKGFSFRLGEGRVIPGWEKGLEVREYTQY